MLVDEIENGFYYDVLERVWAAIAQAVSRFDVQIFATTHSLECIRAAYRSFATMSLSTFGLHRLGRAGSDVRAVTYSRDALAASDEMNLEVR